MKSLLMAVTAIVAFAGVAKADSPLKGLPDSLIKIQQGLIDSGVCQADTPEAGQTAVIAKGQTLFLVPCSYGAYQGSMRGYIVDDNAQLITQVSTLGFDERTKSIVGSIDLMEASYDAKAHSLVTLSKSRGIGDCGSSSKSIIAVDKNQDISIRTIEVRDKSNCDGKDSIWPIKFKQK